MAHHTVVDQILELLRHGNYWFETFTHEPVRTSEEAAKLRTGYTLAQGAKALILSVKQNGAKRFVMVVIPGDQRFNPDKLRAALGAKSTRFATEAEVSDLTGGVQVGGVPPFGQLFGLEVLADPSLLRPEKIIFNAGDRSVSVAMLAADYQKLVQPRVAELV
jgi:Ala-tRNA(Pro) deacylase